MRLFVKLFPKGGQIAHNIFAIQFSFGNYFKAVLRSGKFFVSQPGFLVDISQNKAVCFTIQREV